MAIACPGVERRRFFALAGSLIFASRALPTKSLCGMITEYLFVSRSDGIGRRTGLKIRRWRHRAGSTPAFGTSRCVGIGRQDRLRIYCAIRTWGFDSPHRHHIIKTISCVSNRNGIFRGGEFLRFFIFPPSILNRSFLKKRYRAYKNRGESASIFIFSHRDIAPQARQQSLRPRLPLRLGALLFCEYRRPRRRPGCRRTYFHP